MAPSKLPTLAEIPSLPTEDIAGILDLLFEPCPLLHTLSVPMLRGTVFSSYDDLISNVGRQLKDLYQSASAADTEALDGILSAHPRLGEKKITSEQSSKEQAQLQGSKAEADKLADLNAQYEKAFPGLRYVVFVNGRDRPTIMADMQSRIDRGDIGLERTDAIETEPNLKKGNVPDCSRPRPQNWY